MHPLERLHRKYACACVQVDAPGIIRTEKKLSPSIKPINYMIGIISSEIQLSNCTFRNYTCTHRLMWPGHIQRRRCEWENDMLGAVPWHESNAARANPRKEDTYTTHIFIFCLLGVQLALHFGLYISLLDKRMLIPNKSTTAAQHIEQRDHKNSALAVFNLFFRHRSSVPKSPFFVDTLFFCFVDSGHRE